MQLPVTFLDSDSEPEPDVVYANPWRYRGSHPAADDILLLIEVAHSTRAGCLSERAAVFARAGVKEYWVVDLAPQSVYVLREPQEGDYQYRQECTSGSISSLAFPQVSLRLDELFAQ